MNRVILCGRLSRDPEIRQSGDMTIAKFSLAVDRRVKKGEEKKADFISCTAFGAQADFISKYFKKGDGLTLDGKIQTGSYTNKEGQKVYTTDVIVDNVEFPLGKGSGAANNTSDDNDGFMSIPDGIDEELPFN